MKKLLPDSMKRSKNYAEYGIEYFKGKSSKFWDGMLVGNCPGLHSLFMAHAHMNMVTTDNLQNLGYSLNMKKKPTKQPKTKRPSKRKDTSYGGR